MTNKTIMINDKAFSEVICLYCNERLYLSQECGEDDLFICPCCFKELDGSSEEEIEDIELDKYYDDESSEEESEDEDF